MYGENQICEATTVVHDGVSSGLTSTARLLPAVLTAPIPVPSPLAPMARTIDANAITDDAKAKLEVLIDARDDGVSQTVIAIDARALAASNRATADGRRDTIRRTTVRFTRSDQGSRHRCGLAKSRRIAGRAPA